MSLLDPAGTAKAIGMNAAMRRAEAGETSGKCMTRRSAQERMTGVGKRVGGLAKPRA